METSRSVSERISELFTELGGTINDGFPTIHSQVHHTKAGTPYLKTPGVVVLARPQTNVAVLAGFLEGFDQDLPFTEYLDDPTKLPDSSQLCKTAGQTCYMSFGPRRTTNENAAAYIERLTSAGHGSVLEHSSFNFLLYGTSRSVTHELVRPGLEPLFLRLVSATSLEPCFALWSALNTRMTKSCTDSSRSGPTGLRRSTRRWPNFAGAPGGRGEHALADFKTDARKKVQQTARSLLPNETEAPMVFTGNLRALRHIIEMRADAHAESEIRNLALRIFLCLRTADPILFGDYEPGDPHGTYTVSTKNRKA